MKKYDSYKDSGVEWIGEIPEHWDMTRIGFQSELTVPQRDKPTDLTGEIPWLRIEDFDGKYVNQSKSGQGVSIETVNEMNLKVYPIGTVLTACSCTMGKTAITTVPLITNQTFIGITPKQDLYSDYLYYFLLASSEYLNSISSGAIQSYLSRNEFSRIKIPSIPLIEQTTIANYLDQKTSQIDDLIAKKERLIQLLEEERTAIINQAVTKGLDPTVPMKDSGIEWLGEIPAHWGRARIKTLVKIKVCDGPHETPEWKEDGIPFISAEAIKGNQIDLNFKRGYISEEQHQEYCKKSKVQKGDILFCKSGSTTGKSALVEIDDEFGIWSPLAIIRVEERKISNRYMFQSIQSSLFRNQVETSWTFGTQPNIGMGALENLWIAIPPLNEQELIDEYLISELKNFDAIIAKTIQEIELLKEYKTALISEVVTGKVDVRNEILS